MKPLNKECARCGACTVVCPVYRAVGRESLTARGKQMLLASARASHPSKEFRDIFAQCLLCGACESKCPRGLSTVEAIVEARNRFAEPYGRRGTRKTLLLSILARPRLLAGLVRAGVSLRGLFSLPADSGLWLKLGLPEVKRTNVPDPGVVEVEQPAGDEVISYFPGCFARYVQAPIADASAELFSMVTGEPVVAPAAAGCCGLAAHSAGRQKQARGLARQNIIAFEATRGLILTSCASCFIHLKNYPRLFADDASWRERAEAFSARLREFSEFMLERAGTSGVFAAATGTRVLYHDPCHLRFSDQDDEVPRRLIDSVRDTLRVEPEGGGRCCGQGGLFHLGYPEASAKIFQTSYDAALSEEPDLIVTTCSGCLMQWRAGLAARKSRIRAMHLVSFLAQCRRK